MLSKIEDALRKVYDPEIAVNIFDLGLIYKIDLDKLPTVTVTHTLTSAFCPAADMIPRDVQQKVESSPNLRCKVKITMQPQWGRDMINPEVRELMGI